MSRRRFHRLVHHPLIAQSKFYMRVQEAIVTIQSRWRSAIVQRKVANAGKDTTEKQETLMHSLNLDASMFRPISNKQLDENWMLCLKK